VSDLVFNDMAYGWPAMLDRVLNHGREASPRGQKTREVGPYMFTLAHPSRAVTHDQRRALNHAFSAAEFCWVTAGRDEVETLAFFNSKMRDFADQYAIVDTERGGLKIVPDGALFGAYGPPIVEQLPYVLRNLREPDSRQAVVTIWRPSPPETKDVPCTVMLQFLLRSGKLDLFVVMRSNDLWLGTPYDVPLFCRIQSWVAAMVGAEVGAYHHAAGSLHLYERDFGAARAVVEPHHIGVRPEELVVGPFDPRTDSREVWRMVEAFADPVKSARYDPPPEFGDGWNSLVCMMYEYARRKREREVTRG
jgi:thymidylate synthase